MVRVGIPSKGMRDGLRGAYRIRFAINIIFSFDSNIFPKKFSINASIIDAAKEEVVEFNVYNMISGSKAGHLELNVE